MLAKTSSSSAPAVDALTAPVPNEFGGRRLAQANDVFCHNAWYTQMKI
jgi:hypothetical protein